MQQQLQNVDLFLQSNQQQALNIASSILNKPVSIQSFNGIIGGKNGTYHVDALSYSNPSDYISDWLDSHNQLYNREKNFSYEKSSHRVHRLLSNNFLKNYIEQYLTRTFYRKHLGIQQKRGSPSLLSF